MRYICDWMRLRCKLLQRLRACVDDIMLLSLSMRLNLNPTKSEFTWFDRSSRIYYVYSVPKSHFTSDPCSLHRPLFEILEISRSWSHLWLNTFPQTKKGVISMACLLQLTNHLPLYLSSMVTPCSSVLPKASQGRQSWRVGGRDPPDFGQGVVGSQGVVGVVDGSWNIIISYHVQEVFSKVVIFEKKLCNLSRSSCKWPIFAWKIDVFVKLSEKSKFFEKLPGKFGFFCEIEIFRKFAWKIEFFCEIAWEKRFFWKFGRKIKICLTRIFDPESRPPGFQTKLTPLWPAVIYCRRSLHLEFL